MVNPTILNYDVQEEQGVERAQIAAPVTSNPLPCSPERTEALKRGEWLLHLNMSRNEPDYELLRDYVNGDFENEQEYEEVERLLLETPYAIETVHDLLNELEPEEHPEARRAYLFLRQFLQTLLQVQKLRRYIDAVCAAGDINALTASRAWEAWTSVSEALSKTLLVPDASYGPDGKFLFLWDRGEHHLELEIEPSGVAYFFYRNRTSGAIWDSDYKVGDTLTPEVIEKLRIFA